jgi:hypothetical protein
MRPDRYERLDVPLTRMTTPPEAEYPPWPYREPPDPPGLMGPVMKASAFLIFILILGLCLGQLIAALVKGFGV